MTPNPLDEFGVISRFFTDRSFYPSAWPSQGAGDDCAFLDIGPMRLAVTADMMALGSHFLENASPYSVGRKSLAVNLSDLAAAGTVASMSVGLLAVVDDILSAALKASAKSAGVVIDDAAVTPQYVQGIKPNRELPLTVGGLPIFSRDWGLGEDGKPILGEDGKPLKDKVELDKPIVRFALVKLQVRKTIDYFIK